jgi:hypothetical protein
VAQGSGACNGWTFWHIETKKGLRLIDNCAPKSVRDGSPVISAGQGTVFRLYSLLYA